ncbi:MAG: metalloregulator ArsR/SmtB family transcription factor [Acidobacteria bacterium]|nr:metalloregulator ArsR/SmtB family transcription factor [Acidobacteriota bacterium]
MNQRAAAIHDHLSALADTTRSRILLLLDRHELTVTELCAVLQLPQSTVSRHLKALADSGWIASRAEATSNLYSMTRAELDPAARRLWLLVREHVGPTPSAAHDQRRLHAALAERRTKSQEFFSSSAGQWDRVRDEMFGDRFHLAALAAFAECGWTVGDLGCGTGQVSAALAPFVKRVVAVDASAAMLQAAKRRLQEFDNVDLRRGDLEALLPIDEARLDAATLMLVLHHVPDPARALAEVARVLKPGGRVIIVDMLPHDRESYRQQMGHVWLGFSEEHLRRLLGESGFGDVRIVALPPDARAKGPGLFVATARRRTEAGSFQTRHTGGSERTRPTGEGPQGPALQVRVHKDPPYRRGSTRTRPSRRDAWLPQLRSSIRSRPRRPRDASRTK